MDNSIFQINGESNSAQPKKGSKNDVDSVIEQKVSNAIKRIYSKYKNKIRLDIDSIQAEVAEIKKFREDCLVDKTGQPSVKSKVNSLNQQIENVYANAQEKYNEIISLHSELLEGNSTTDSIEDTIKELVTSAETKVEEIGEKKKDIELFHEKIFGKDLTSKTPIDGYKQKFDSELKKVNDFLKGQQEKYNAQFEQIKSLLPGATSIGLAKAFEEQKRSYSKSINRWSGVFVGTMLVMIAFGIIYIIEISGISDLNVTKAFISIINKLPFFVPTVWLAVFSSKQLSQNRRLQQEYAFKETFAKSYDGQKTQLEKLDLDDEEANNILKQLLEKLVLITSHNPSDTLESEKHTEKGPFGKSIEDILQKRTRKEANTAD